MKKLIVPLLMITTSLFASEKVSHNQVINYKSLYVQSLAELERLESKKDNLENELDRLEEIGEEIAKLKKDISDTYNPRVDLIKPLSKGYFDAFINYYGLVYSFRQTSYNKRIIDYFYDYLLIQYNGALLYAKTNLDIGNDYLEIDMYNNVKVNGEKLVK